MAKLELPDSIKIVNPKPVDAYYSNDGTPYVDTAAAIAAVPSGVRYIGLTVNVANVEYCWGTGLLDVDLVRKATLKRKYVHSQGTASATWTINHNLGEEPNITIYDSSIPAKKVIGPIEHTSVNQATVTLPNSVSGKAICLI